MKKIIVTGAAGGIGEAVVTELISSGYFVYALDIKDVPMKENLRSFKCDLTKKEEILKVHEVIKSEGKIDSLIHLSGAYRMDSLIEISEESFRKIFDINFFSVYLVNQTFLDLLDENGKIIITSSEVAPLDPLPFNGIYSLTKNTLENYACSLRQELNLKGYQVIIIRPGAVNTGLIDDSLRNVERIEKETLLYKENAPLFKDIVKKNESKTIEPRKIAKLYLKVLKKRKPRLIYSINLNPKLKLLSALPKRMQLYLIKKMITPK
ncbi:MAG: SDR family NAD(P)-dependent oxidoreductase [Bacilli bacterium]|nr:SDR family NAD(P)-dependent oxidoreductase [Bacilli bacterium]